MWSRHWAAELLSLSLVIVPLLGLAADSSIEISRLGATRGICVVVTSEENDLPFELATNSELTVYVQSGDAAVVAALQQTAAARGLLGTRIYVEQGSLAHLQLADNLADGHPGRQ